MSEFEACICAAEIEVSNQVDFTAPSVTTQRGIGAVMAEAV